MMHCRIPTHHKEVSHPGFSPVLRAPSRAFAPPVPSMMREPGTNYMTVLTSHGVITLTNGQMENARYIEHAQRGEAIMTSGARKAKKAR